LHAQRLPQSGRVGIHQERFQAASHFTGARQLPLHVGGEEFEGIRELTLPLGSLGEQRRRAIVINAVAQIPSAAFDFDDRRQQAQGIEHAATGHRRNTRVAQRFLARGKLLALRRTRFAEQLGEVG